MLQSIESHIRYSSPYLKKTLICVSTCTCITALALDILNKQALVLSLIAHVIAWQDVDVTLINALCQDGEKKESIAINALQKEIDELKQKAEIAGKAIERLREKNIAMEESLKSTKSDLDALLKKNPTFMFIKNS